MTDTKKETHEELIDRISDAIATLAMESREDVEEALAQRFLPDKVADVVRLAASSLLGVDHDLPSPPWFGRRLPRYVEIFAYVDRNEKPRARVSYVNGSGMSQVEHVTSYRHTAIALLTIKLAQQLDADRIERLAARVENR